MANPMVEGFRKTKAAVGGPSAEGCLAVAEDVPCSPRAGDPGQGQICVCNSTYCDTIERPTTLPRGQYHHYTTSNSTPGFTHTTGSFNLHQHEDNSYDILFKIDNSVQYQEIIGFGGSFSDSAGIVISELPEEAQDNLIKSYFGKDGIEYTLCRTTIGGSDFSGRPYYTLDDVPYDDGLTQFSLTHEDYAYKIPYIQKAMAVSDRGIKLYGCAWNSPQWMKTSYSQGKGGAGYVRERYLKTYAQYHVKFLEEYKKNQIDIWGISGGNEVMLGVMVGLNCTQQLANIQRNWLKDYLTPQLSAANLSDVKFLGMDDMRLFALYWGDRFADDTEAYKLSGGIALHWYLDFFIPPSVLDKFHEKHPEQMIIYTESSINPVFFSGPGDPAVQFGSWRRAALYMHNMIENLNHWTQGYIDWNLALNMTGGPYLYLALDAAVIVNNITGEFYKQPMFYALGHFSKFIPPGSKRVGVTAKNHTSYDYNDMDDLDVDKILEIYRKSKIGETVNLEAIKPVSAPEIVECVASTNPDGSNTIIVLNNKNVTARVKLDIAQLGTVTLDLEEKSLNTFVYWM
ncbi:putative glucosylceramidase 4 [Macrosteles quadrilineatus]|uniref:putative glucosylceramidase 4 n=1 Tax=Macrosteles quadrilineatus TaxID=74068 RepID=UPI0023E2EFFC|nr:putative glucosylceramidase 4 [Macrosteles quadrilineatus]